MQVSYEGSWESKEGQSLLRELCWPRVATHVKSYSHRMTVRATAGRSRSVQSSSSGDLSWQAVLAPLACCLNVLNVL